jgi:F-type H+-transporting ATPase subunit alpha
LDASTKARLERGKRTQEVLKQGLHHGIQMEEEAMILYALTHGFLDSVAVEKISRYEESLYLEMKTQPEAMELKKIITDTKQLPDSSKLDSYFKEFNKRFM